MMGSLLSDDTPSDRTIRTGSAGTAGVKNRGSLGFSCADDPVAASVFGPVEGIIGNLDEGIDIRTVLGKRSYPEAYGDLPERL